LKTIVVIVQPNGETKIKTKGFSGSTCKDASRFLEQALGVASSDQMTAEFHQQAPQQQSQQQGGAA
jgi:hypothetical protein